MNLRIGILGSKGRMGQLIAAEIAARGDCNLAGGIDRDENLADLLPRCDVLIDFSHPSGTTAFAAAAAAAGKALVTGTTGLDDTGQAAIRAAASAIPLLQASNTSLSLAVMRKAVAMVAARLAPHGYDVGITDLHHRMKKDAPSGTAKTLAAAVHAGAGDAMPVQFADLRLGDIVGQHSVTFAGMGEMLQLNHAVTDRRIFARGAITAALWLQNRPAGLYSMDDVLGLTT